MKLFFTLFITSLLAVKTLASSPYLVEYHYSREDIDLQKVSDLRFKALSSYKELRESGKSGHYLFRITFSQPTPADGYLLFIENEHLDSISLYTRQGNSLLLSAHAGNSFPETANRFGLPQFRLQNDREFYVLTKFGNDVNLNFRIDSMAEMSRWNTKVFFKLGLYYGFSFMFFVLNLFLFLYLRDRVFLYYCVFQFFIVGSIAYADGLFPLIFQWRWLLNKADIPLHIGLALSGSVFALAFLEKKRNSPLGKITSAFLAVIFTTYVFSQLLESYPLFLAGEVLVLLLLCFLWAVAAGQFKQDRHSRFFALGYGVFLIFAIDYFLLRKLGIYVLDFYMGQLKTGSLIEMLVLSAAIVLRMTTLQDENLQYRRTIEMSLRRIEEFELQEADNKLAVFEKAQQRYALTERELEVLMGISEGLTNNQIADKVFLSVHTVKFHTRNIFEKLSINNRTQALGKLNELSSKS